MRHKRKKILLSCILLSLAMPSFAKAKSASGVSSHKKVKSIKSHKSHKAKKRKHGHKNYMEGPASFYSRKFSGRKMANGERYDPEVFSAAHAKLPLGTKLKVTNIDNDSDNGRVLYVEVTDRMSPYTKNILDLSPAAAKYLNHTGRGLRVRLEVVSDQEFESHDMNKN